MPIFEYRCGQCAAEFEWLHATASADAPSCPACGAAGAERLISRFAVNRGVTPCGSTRSAPPAACGYRAREGGCDGCAF
ncbi:MAG TPA: zinc ribbon domain-containing protein [Chthonomonadales bacterium]|nr:zinc ribbon domain-containing protein [Chthonomonadales bacterium]